MAEAATGGHGLGKWIVAGLVLALGAVSLAVAGTAAQRAPAREAGQFLKTNAEKPGVTTTASGLQVEMLAAGEGPTPTISDTVAVHYEGRLADGTVFDSSYQRGQPAIFGVADVIPGWTEGLQLMRPGGKARFTIPPELGYGAQGAGGVIPPNAVLVFDVELLAIAPKN
ncbi:FKBP-type peptidyl-prolyl cis-trans isomerase [Sandaracinobacter neustonicus]|uniref:Peptidyl-prolyl cis-trans isomerase n=1 Tax=Sandaracinobacter neustonicus TaxID=1715348 RepID=A0A501XVH4_9SPHN|nr:FKBP-type peptidyl-prolyl cis-trans isomerase [Sandaracinobacter neustonicus]TPE64591.1 FKBP-type peptidyl-prolyl cis-trans isomerase [Sandaracinobacter neustonicus]